MRRKVSYFVGFILLIIGIHSTVYAKTNTTYIDIEITTISTSIDQESSIQEYSTLDAFLTDYNANCLPDIYITNFLFDGVSAVKCPDLDDFIENQSNDTKIKTLEIKVLNIHNIGNYELTGKATGMMIAVNTNGLKGNIDLILNNIDLDTDSKKAPAIYIYNQETTNTDCKVTIKTKEGSKNYIEGGKLKKVSLLPTDQLDTYKNNYSGQALSNYESYPSYYGIYTSNEISNILFATVKADQEDLQDGDPYLFYKGSGAISSDIDLYFEGEGFLRITSKNKEGIETKGNLILSGGQGDYEVYAYDDCLNTTTPKSAGSNVRNTMIIDVHSLLAIVDDEGDEGDAIDSNGSLTINGGNIYAFANSNSQDSGLDSEEGVVINGGCIIATGNMSDMISNESKQKYIYLTLNSKVEADTLIVIKDEKGNIITAFQSDKSYSTILYSAGDLNYSSLKVYSGGVIEGEQVNGLYTNITNYQGGTEISYKESGNFINEVNQVKVNNSSSNSFILKLLIGEVVALAVVLIYVYIEKKNQKN